MKASKCLQGLVLKDIPVRHGTMTTRFLCPTCVSRYYYLDKGEIKSYIIYLDRLEWNQMLEMNMIACLKEALSDCLLQTDNWYIGQNFDPFIFLKGCHGDDWKSSKSLWSQRETWKHAWAPKLHAWIMGRCKGKENWKWNNTWKVGKWLVKYQKLKTENLRNDVWKLKNGKWKALKQCKATHPSWKWELLLSKFPRISFEFQWNSNDVSLEKGLYTRKHSVAFEASMHESFTNRHETFPWIAHCAAGV